MPTELNIAVIGLGRMGRIYAETVVGTEGARLIAIATVDLATQTEFVCGLDVPYVFEDAADALALSELDAVIVATPTHSHLDLVEQAAAAGKAIFCEKPLALTIAETHQALNAVERAGVPLQVGFMRRYDPPYIRAKAAIDAGDIGQPVTFKSISRDPICPRLEFADPVHSGGLIIDMGIHDMDLARWLMGAEVERVTAEGTIMVCKDLETVADFDNAVINLRFVNGALGNVDVSRNARYGYDIRTEVLGSRAAVRVGDAEPASRWLLAPNGRSDGSGSYLTERFGAAYSAQIREFVACVREGSQPVATGADALAAFEISLAATYAARTGEPVRLDAVRSGWLPDNIHRP